MNEIGEFALFSLPFAILLSAFLLDLAIGDPRFLPHPVRFMGALIENMETQLRGQVKGPRGERWAGAVLAFSVPAVSLLVTLLILQILNRIAVAFSSPFVSVIVGLILVYLVSTTLALRDLIAASRRISGLLEERRIAEARVELSFVVGRDTEGLSADEIRKAILETLAENLSDGVIAPLFYLALGGLPLALAYKAINTLDSMVGYKNQRYRHFGWASARLDDLANYLPARITGLLLVMASGFALASPRVMTRAFRTMRNDGKRHASPNAGLPEAALAGALGVRLGGPACYGGIRMEKPYLGREETNDYRSAVVRAEGLVILAASFGLASSAFVLYLRSAS